MFHSDMFDKVNNFRCIVLTIIVPEFDLAMSFGKVKFGILYSKLRRNSEPGKERNG